MSDVAYAILRCVCHRGPFYHTSDGATGCSLQLHEIVQVERLKVRLQLPPSKNVY
jgi:hypothetical protein